MSTERMERIRARLQSALTPQRLDISDDSAAHAGHPGARLGGHYSVLIVAEVFRGQSTRERHRTIYAALGELFSTDIHALSIRALAPGENAAGDAHG